MLIRQITTQEFQALKLTDNVQIALITMEDYNLANLAVVANDAVVGYVRFAELEAANPTDELAEYMEPAKYLDPDGSFFEALALFARTGYETLAVQQNGQFFGNVWVKDLVIALGNSLSATNDGAVLAVRCRVADYSIAQLGRIIESNDGKILGLWTWMPESGNQLDIMIKLNIRHIDNLTHVLEANGYKTLFRVNDQSDDLNEARFQSLLRYLDI
ncbi:MAG: hypothetical protein KDC76_10015 [Bacteroidetes bacterium]|nr:hypothetical protein [Bacteroidota bacterium]